MQPNGPWHGQQQPQQHQQQQQYGQAPYAQQMGYIANPYAAPAPALYRENGFVPFGATAGPLPNPTLKTVKLVLALVGMIGGFALMMVGAMTDVSELAILGSAILGLGYLCVFATMALTIYWNYVFWSWVPPDQRWTNMWKKYISPGTFVGFMFIPYFNIYWMFVTYIGITDVLERMRVQYPSRQPNLKNQAIMTLVISIVFFPAAPILQYLFQKKVEEMAHEMTASMPRTMV